MKSLHVTDASRRHVLWFTCDACACHLRSVEAAAVHGKLQTCGPLSSLWTSVCIRAGVQVASSVWVC
jgi:hypothetical protein